MKCEKCNNERDWNDIDDEIVCEKCGAAYCLEYQGYYPEGSNNRIDEGFESEEWKKEVEAIKNE